jgi:hypothetical protein
MKQTKNFREFTFGWIIFAAIIPALALLVFFFVTGRGSQPLDMFGFVFAAATLLASIVLFYGLTTEVTQDTICVSFGFGLIRKRIPLSRIKSAEPVKSPWYYGWGIHFIPKGMIFNINGSGSVELRFKDSDRVFRIGTKEPETLRAEITKRIEQ